MSEYKEGDRVLVVDIHSPFYAEEGVVKSKSKDTISVSLDVGPILSRSTKRRSDFQKITTGTIKPVVQCSAQIVAVESEQSHREQPSVSSTGGAKNVKPEKFSLIPTQALAKVAEHYGVGAEKYAAHQWRQGYEWSKSYDALQRHANAFWAGEDNDPETKTPHMAAVAFHALTLLTFMDEHPNHDDRYKEAK